MLRTLFAIISAVFVVLRLPPPLDEIMLASTVMDWLRANANFATLATFSQTKFNSMIFMPPTHMALQARRQALRRVFVILRNQALSEYNPN
jgi:hypothetical protein